MSKYQNVAEHYDYSNKTRGELIAICKDRGLKGYSKKTKPELIAILSSLTEPIMMSQVNECISTSDDEILKNTFHIGDNIMLLKKFIRTQLI
jgi:hypothetical protein